MTTNLLISRYRPSLGWRRSWINGTVWNTMTTNLPMSRYHPSLGWRRSWLYMYGTVWTTMTTYLPISRYRPSLGWRRSWMYGQSKPHDYQPANIKVSPIPRLAQELNLRDNLNHMTTSPYVPFAVISMMVLIAILTYHISLWRGCWFLCCAAVINPHQNDQGRKGPCFFQGLIALKCLKCQKI